MRLLRAARGARSLGRPPMPSIAFWRANGGVYPEVGQSLAEGFVELLLKVVLPAVKNEELTAPRTLALLERLAKNCKVDALFKSDISKDDILRSIHRYSLYVAIHLAAETKTVCPSLCPGKPFHVSHHMQTQIRVQVFIA